MEKYKYIGEDCSLIKKGDVIEAEPYTVSYFMGKNEKRLKVTKIDVYSFVSQRSIGISIDEFKKLTK